MPLRADGINALFNAIRPAGFDLPEPLNVSKTSVNFMRNYQLEAPQNLENSRPQVMADAWKDHPFYQNAVVLGLDIGLKGIGVCVRRGPEIVYARTWVFDVPKASRLEGRRANRAARHCRANRRVRLNRLKRLMAMHGLPWVEEESRAMRATDPFVLRHRAVTRQLASKEALSIAIRHCVAHRGYDYEYFSEEGEYPWGDSTEFKAVKNALHTLWLTASDARKALADAAEFEDWSSSQREEFHALVAQRTSGPEILEARLATHARENKKHLRLRAKGEAFPRKFVWEHLEKIIRRHAHLIENPEGFLEALAVKPVTPESRARAIFFFHRKTPEEMRAHFEKKRRRCNTSLWLGKGEQPIAKASDPEVRKFRVLEFLISRTIEVVCGRTRGNPGIRDFAKVPVLCAQSAIEMVEMEPGNRLKEAWKNLQKDIAEEVERAAGAVLAPVRGREKSEHNQAFWKQLQDLLVPKAASRKANASMSTAAARSLFEIATENGFEPEAVTAALGDYFRFRRQPQIDLDGVYPQIEFLLGQRVRKERSRGGKKRGDLANPGKLQRLWQDLSDRLGENEAPDYCVIEMARDVPRNAKERKEIEDRIKENEKRRQDLYEKYQLPADASGSARRRVELYEQQGGMCPFTGAQLGSPLNEELEIEHLFPRENGGLSMDENLVLTFRSVNNAKGCRTPREYAADCGIAFDAMLEHTRGMRWGRRKRELFAWEDPAQIPELGNTTRVAQLAKQLWGEMAEWMGIHQIEDPTERENERARRIGTPTGFMTAACRRAWGFPKKDRSDMTHHLVDATLLAFIPPQKGLSFTGSGGIFYPQLVPNGRRNGLGVLPLGPDPAEVAWMSAPDAPECPIVYHRSSSPHRSLHDTTMWRVLPDGRLAQRTPVDREKTSAEQLLNHLHHCGIPQNRVHKDGSNMPLIPSRAAIERWLNEETNEPLRLLDGTPVRTVWKRCGKGDLEEDPIGFLAEVGPAGELRAVKVINEKWDRIEIWRGWDPETKKWSFYKQLVPSKAVLAALEKMGLRWDQRPKKPWRPGAAEMEKSLKESIAGPLPPYARPAVHPVTGKPVVLRKGGQFLANLSADVRLAKRGQPVASKKWVSLASVGKESGGRVEIKDVFSGEKMKDKPSLVDDLAFLAGLPSADDSSSYPTQRRP